MSTKQKRALAVLLVAAITTVTAALAPGVHCDPDQELIEDALDGGDESTSGAGPDLGAPANSSESSGSSST